MESQCQLFFKYLCFTISEVLNQPWLQSITEKHYEQFFFFISQLIQAMEVNKLQFASPRRKKRQYGYLFFLKTLKKTIPSSRIQFPFMFMNSQKKKAKPALCLNYISYLYIHLTFEKKANIKCNTNLFEQQYTLNSLPI